MEQEELKRKLMGLWEKTTHNSKELLGVLFDYYFDMRYIEYIEHEGKIISALCGIPYFFGYGKKQLKGLYIIPLSQEEGYRKKGTLSELLMEFNLRLKEDFDFTFLLPHTALLADYYGTQGYFSSFFILEERFTPLHDFRNDYYLSLNDSDERIRELKIALMDETFVSEFKGNSQFSKNQIIQFIEEIEHKGSSYVNLCHTKNDLEYLLQDHTVKNLNIYISYDAEKKITGIVFTQKEELKRTRVIASYVADSCSYYSLLEFIKNQFPDNSISINTFDPKIQTHAIIQQTYASSNPYGGDLDNTFSSIEIPFNMNKLLQPLGMVRLLRFDTILDFLASKRSDADFKLLIREPKESDREVNNGSEKRVFVVKNGKCSEESYDKYLHDNTVLKLTPKEVSELLLRKNDSSNLIMEAFGIPRLDLQIRLLPC